MPYYVITIKEKGKAGKTYNLPTPVFAPCVGEAWDEATKMVPKNVTVVDVVPEEEKKKRR